MNPSDLSLFKRLVTENCGLSLDGASEVSLVSALRKRMKLCACETAPAYLARVRANPAELQELVSLLTINETYFFREPQQLAYLVDTLVPRLLAQRTDGQPLRILSAGCSSGEEPYSIAIALKEKFGDACAHLVNIVAGDIDHMALARAKAAQYGHLSFRAIPPALHQRYFQDLGKRSYRLCPEIQSLVDFQPLNLLRSPFSDGMDAFDIVMFRNVSLYFDRENRKIILQGLHAAMRERGVLILGAAETMANDLGVFQMYQEQGQFYFAKGQAGQPGLLMPPVPPGRTQAIPAARTVNVAVNTAPRQPPARPVRMAAPSLAPSPAQAWSTVLASVRQSLREKQFQAALDSARAEHQRFAAEMRFALLEAYVYLQMRRFAQARELAERLLAQDGWLAEVYMLLGLLAKWQEDSTEAIRCFKMLVYCRPDCWPAHYHLATLLQAQDDANAKRAFATALRQITANPDPDGGLQLPLDLPVADIRFLCERRSQMPSGVPAPRRLDRCGA